MKLEVTRRARADIGAALRWSEDQFGVAARVRYRGLIEAGLVLITVPNDPIAVRVVRSGHISFRLLHLRNCHARAAGISRPRHLIAYDRPEPGLVVVTRLLHDAMDLSGQLED